MCKFAHIRSTVDGVIPPTGGLTIAYENLGNGLYIFALAKCNPHDNFQRRLGRVKAQGRLKSEKHHVYVDNISSDKELVSYVVKHFDSPASV